MCNPLMGQKIEKKSKKNSMAVYRISNRTNNKSSLKHSV